MQLDVNKIIVIAIILYLIIGLVVGAIAVRRIKRGLRDLDGKGLGLSRADKVVVCVLATTWGYILALFVIELFSDLMQSLKNRKPKNNLCLPHAEAGDL